MYAHRLKLLTCCSSGVEYVHSTPYDKAPSVSALLQLVHVLGKPHGQGDHPDRDASGFLKIIDPMTSGLNAAPADFWDFVLKRCLIVDTTDTILIRIYRLGLIRTAQTLYGKSLTDRNSYLLARTIVRRWHGVNIGINMGSYHSTFIAGGTKRYALGGVDTES